MSIEPTLRRVSLFSHLSDTQLEELARTGRTLSLPPNHTVVREGDESDDLYVMLSGRAEVYRCDDQGREVALATLEEGANSASRLCLIAAPDRPRSQRSRTASYSSSIGTHSRHSFSSPARKWCTASSPT